MALRAFWAVLLRDLKLAFGSGSGLGLGIAFFVLICAIIPFSLGPSVALHRLIAPGIIWAALLLAVLLTLDRLFQADAEDGSLDLLSIGPLMLEAIVFAKICGHWLCVCIPLILTIPFVALILNLPFAELSALVVPVLLGSPALSCLGAIGAALTAGLKRGGLLSTILSAPLYFPTLLIGALAIKIGVADGNVMPLWLVLGAISLVSAVIAPIAAAIVLRLSLS